MDNDLKKITLTKLQQMVASLPSYEQRDQRLWLSRIQKRIKQKLPHDRSLDKFQKQLMTRIKYLNNRKLGLPKFSFPENLPITQHVEELTKAISENQVVIVAGETGSGKTTQLPKICLALGRGITGQIGHTQPRRLAARSVASRIAEELNCELGKKIGYQVRFDDRSSNDGYIKLMTDGILLNELHHDPLLKKYDTLIIDEAHERSLNIDFILGILRQVLLKRPDLRVIITSATIDPQRFSEHFNQAPMIEVSGRTYPVETRYQPLFSESFDESNQAMLLEEGIYKAVEELICEGDGDILVFLPGEQDIRQIADYLRRHLGQYVEVLPLYSRLAQSEQMRIFSKSRSSKITRIILSTNVAETSLTVPGIHYVIDSGDARMSRYSVRSKIQRLPIEAISQASANQRQGRCGRIADGICIRLYSEDDFNTRPEFTDPEIKRTNLASVILQMAMLELGTVEEFEFLDPPDTRVINDGYKLLQELGAMNSSREITALGKQLAVLPVDPKIGRILLAGSENDALNELLILASAMSLPDPRERPVDKQQQADEKHRRFEDKDSDFCATLNLWHYFNQTKDDTSWNQLRKLCLKEFLNFNRLREWREIYGQLKRLMIEQKHQINKTSADYDAIHKSLLSGLISQIGEKTSDGDYQSTRQNRFFIFPGSGLFAKREQHKQQPDKSNKDTKSRSMKWLLAGELVETQKLYARQVAKINPCWVEDIAPDLLNHQYSEPYWSKKAGRAMVKENLTLYGLTVISNRPKALALINPELAHELFIFHALVENDFNTRAESIVHNRKCLEQVEAMEHRARRRDILVEQDYLESFYAERIPKRINNGQLFEIWYKKSTQSVQDNLKFAVDDLIREEAEEIDRDAFPEYLTINNISLALEYHFEPGAEDDGIHIILPIAYINQFKESDFDWLVPGMLENKIIALLRGLPKVLRKNFVPVPDYAKALIKNLNVDSKTTKNTSLLTQIEQQLRQMTSVLITEDDFDSLSLPDNLLPLFFLTDMDDVKVIDTSRSLSALQKKYSNNALDFLVEERVKETFDSFPELGYQQRSTTKLGDNEYELFTGIEIDGDAFSFKTFDKAEQAEHSTRESIVLLLLKELNKSITDMKRHLPELNNAELYYSTFPKSASDIYQQGNSALYVDLFTLVCESYLDKDNHLINSIEGYNDLKQQLSQQLLPDIVENNKLLIEIFRQSEMVRKKLKKISSASLINVANNLQERLQSLMYCGFLTHTGWQQLTFYPRYLKALSIRYERAEHDPQSEKQRSLIWNKWWGKYLDAANQSRTNRKKDLLLKEFRWLLEEFHVSLFAQQLGTKRSVSEKRLDKVFNDYEQL